MNRFEQIRFILTKASTWAAVLAIVSATYGIFGAKPTAQWQVLKDEATNTTLPTNDVDAAPPDSVVYKGFLLDEQKQKEFAEKLSAALTIFFSLLAAILGQRETPPGTPPHWTGPTP